MTAAKEAVENAPNTFAKVSVRAETPTAARYHAWVNLNAALNVLAYATSVSARAGGLKPEIDIESAVYPVDRGQWSSQWHKTRAELYERDYKATDQLVQLSKTYDYLVSLEANNQRQMNELQMKFMQAIPWYVKGRWEPNATERFLFYWIATEHLFSKGRRMDPFFRTLPNLIVTWRDIPSHAITFLSRSRQFLVQYIAEDANLRVRVDANPNLIHWQSDHRVLMRLGNLPDLLNLSRYAQPERREFIKRFVRDVRRLHRRKAALQDATEDLRTDYQFRLQVLYKLRNQMVHAALAYIPAMQLYAEELESTVEKILTKMSDFVVDQASPYTTMSQLIDAYQEPFI